MTPSTILHWHNTSNSVILSKPVANSKKIRDFLRSNSKYVTTNSSIPIHLALLISWHMESNCLKTWLATSRGLPCYLIWITSHLGDGFVMITNQRPHPNRFTIDQHSQPFQYWTTMHTSSTSIISSRNLKMDWRRLEHLSSENLFIEDVQHVEYPRRFILPTMSVYSVNIDPQQQLVKYEWHMDPAKATDAIKFRCFPYSSKG